MNASPTTTLRGERGPPPHFAGREAELSLLRRRLDIALHERDPSIEGLLLISGIPGIGKTHLIDHFIRQQAANKNVKALFLDTHALSSPEGLLALVGRAMNAEDQFARAAGMDDKVTGVRGTVAGVVSGGVTLDAHRPSLELFHLLHATKDLPAWRGKALVLVVDEVQNVDSRSSDQLQTLHEGRHGCPILAIAAGLQQARTVLGERGISRMSHRQLGLLSADETVEAVYHGLTNLGVDVSEDTAKKLAKAAMRFPQHVHGHLAAALNVYEQRGEVNSSDALAEALKKGCQAREDYYVDRMSAMGKADELYPLAEHMAAYDVEVVPQATAESIVGSDTVDAAVRHGVLSVQEDRLLSFGIPSFRSYMIGRAAAYREIANRKVPNKAPTR